MFKSCLFYLYLTSNSNIFDKNYILHDFNIGLQEGHNKTVNTMTGKLDTCMPY